MRWDPNCNGNRRVKMEQRSTEDCLFQKCQIQDYQNKNWLSVCRMLSLQLKPKLGRKKPAIGPHAARGLWIGHKGSRPRAGN